MSKYDHTSIKVMEEIEHIQENAGMYIGDTGQATHLITEAFDNAIDEAKAGYANIVAVYIDTKKKEYYVIDNGRGIPIENDTIKTVASKLFSGGKFNKGEGKVYEIASGRHGVGIVAITALSEYSTIEVYRDNKYAFYKWENANLVEDRHEDFRGTPKFSTRIGFRPNKKYFSLIDVDISYIKKRMKIASVHIPQLQLVLVVDDKKEIINCDLNTYFKEDVILKETKNLTKPHDIKTKIKGEELLIRWCYSFEGSPAPKQHGCVNLLSVDQGTHINKTADLFRDVFQEFSKKDKLHFNKNDSLVGFRCYTSIMLYNPEYSSQNKEKLSSAKSKLDPLYNKAETELRKYLNDNRELRNKLLSYFEAYRKRLDSSKSIIKTSGTVTRINSVIGSKLKDCTTHSIDKSELYIMEGASAGGTLLNCRNPNVHAVLPLKGKIPNVAGQTKDFLKNEEIKEIINACGTGIEPDFHLNGLRYGKIIITCDADSDGNHISALLLVLFLKLTPKLIIEGKIYLAQMPLYGADYKKTFYPFYTEKEKEEFIKKYPNAQIMRFKGLGEMNDIQLEKCLLDVKTRKLKQIPSPKHPSEIFTIMTNPEEKRRLV